MPALVGQRPIFEFFLPDSMIVPAVHKRIEIERTAGSEQVRVIDDATGDYHSATGRVAVDIISELDRRTGELHENEGPAFPPGVLSEKDEESCRSLMLIMYDHEGHRLLVAIRHKATFDNHDEFNAKATAPLSVIFVTEDFVGAADRRTGHVWWASEEVANRTRKAMESSSCLPPGHGEDERRRETRTT